MVRSLSALQVLRSRTNKCINVASCDSRKIFWRERMTSFEEYINSLKEEAERGSNPNSSIALDKFIKVADNIVCRVKDIEPIPSMT